jgi:hypothetical protein
MQMKDVVDQFAGAIVHQDYEWCVNRSDLFS